MVLVFAMVFLVLFAAMAVGLANLTRSSVQVTRAEQGFQQAQASADAGMEFTKSVISSVKFTGSVPTDVLNGIYTALTTSGHSVYFSNVANTPVRITAAATTTGGTPSITYTPYLYIGGSGGSTTPLTIGQDVFTTVISYNPTTTTITVSVTGKDAKSTCAKRVSYSLSPSVTNSPPDPHLFEYGVYSFGGMTVGNGGGTTIVGSNTYGNSAAKIMSALTTNNAVTLGQAYLTSNTVYVAGNTCDPAAVVSVSGDTHVNGVARPYPLTDAWERSVFLRDLNPPQQPTFSTSDFANLPNNAVVDSTTNTQNFGTSQTHKKNVRIRAGTNPVFSGNCSVDGFLYIESPNTISIGGTFNMNGVIIFEQKTANTSDALCITGGFNLGTIPTGSDFDAIRSLATGYSILAPNATINYTSSNANTFVGSIVCKKWDTRGGGNSRCTIRDGSLITLSHDIDSCMIVNDGFNIYRSSSTLAPPTDGISGGGSGTTQYVLNKTTYSEN